LITFLTEIVKSPAGTLVGALTARIYGFHGLFAKERIARDNTNVCVGNSGNNPLAN
jgi:hypothetical protein